jgi:hypothetical protein
MSVHPGMVIVEGVVMEEYGSVAASRPCCVGLYAQVPERVETLRVGKWGQYGSVVGHGPDCPATNVTKKGAKRHIRTKLFEGRG